MGPPGGALHRVRAPRRLSVGWTLSLSLVLVLAPAAAGARPADDAVDAVVRVFVHSAAGELRSELGVRHDFGDLFSTNIPAGKLAELRARGVAVEEVPARALALLPDEPGSHKPSHPAGSTGRAVPSDQTPYGIEQIYNDPAIASTTGGAGLKLGHLDTGVDTAHPDLVNRVAKCASTVGGSCRDRNGHGTHTAGSAVADAGSDDKGVWGVAPEASLFAYKVCTTFCFVDDTMAAIDGCIADGCHVITFSIGGDFPSEAERSKIAEFNTAGGLFVAAAGNDGPGLGSIDYPAAFKEAVAVAALTASKGVPDFSSRGTNDDADPTDEDGEVELAAAGVSVESTWKGGGYKKLSGTSMATPHVSGLALKKWAGSGAATRAALQVGVEDITAGAHAAVGVDPASGSGLPHV